MRTHLVVQMVSAMVCSKWKLSSGAWAVPAVMLLERANLNLQHVPSHSCGSIKSMLGEQHFFALSQDDSFFTCRMSPYPKNRVSKIKDSIDQTRTLLKENR